MKLASRVFVLFIVIAFSISAAWAAEWKPKQIEIVMPHEVSSNHNGVQRALGKYWAEYLDGVNLVYVNRGQADGRLGLDYFAAAPADGTSILSLNIYTQAVVYAQQKPPWDWDKLFVPVGSFGMDPGAIVVKQDSPFQSFQQILDESKKRKLVAGVSRWSSSDGLFFYQLMEMVPGTQFEVVPFGSGGKVRAAAMGGHVDLVLRRSADVVKSNGKLRAVAITFQKNTVPHLVGNIPTVSEILGKRLVTAGSDRSIMLHRELKEKYPDRFKWLADTFFQAKNDPRYIEEAKKQGVDDFTDSTPEELEHDINALRTLYEKYKYAYRDVKK